MAWALPDLVYTSEAWALVEFAFEASNSTSKKSLADAITISVHAATPESAPIFLMATLPPLSIVDAAQRAATATDELLARRLLEVARCVRWKQFKGGAVIATAVVLFTNSAEHRPKPDLGLTALRRAGSD